MDEPGTDLRWVRALLLSMAAASVVACSNLSAPTYGAREGQLRGCEPGSPCLSSQMPDGDAQHVEPFYYSVSRQEARAILRTVLGLYDDIATVSSHRNYVRIEIRDLPADHTKERVFEQVEVGIVDVEFYLQPGRKLIQVRAAARPGTPADAVSAERIKDINRNFHLLHARVKDGEA